MRRFANTESSEMQAKVIQKILENQIADNFYINDEMKKKVKQLLATMDMEAIDEDLMDDIDYAFDAYAKAMQNFFYYAEKLEDLIKLV
jgi:hypothetical protein